MKATTIACNTQKWISKFAYLAPNYVVRFTRRIIHLIIMYQQHKGSTLKGMIEIAYAAKILYGSFARSMQNSALPHTYLRVAKQLKFFEFADAITNFSCFSYDLCTSSYVAVITIISKGRPTTGHSCSGTTTCRQRNIIYYTNESLQV